MIARLAIGPADGGRVVPSLRHAGAVLGADASLNGPRGWRACPRLAVDSITSLRLVTGRTCSDLAWSPARALRKHALLNAAGHGISALRGSRSAQHHRSRSAQHHRGCQESHPGRGGGPASWSVQTRPQPGLETRARSRRTTCLVCAPHPSMLANPARRRLTGCCFVATASGAGAVNECIEQPSLVSRQSASLLQIGAGTQRPAPGRLTAGRLG